MNLDLGEVTGLTPLSIAVQKRHHAVVKALIKAGANVNKAENVGKTPLFMLNVYVGEEVRRLRQ